MEADAPAKWDGYAEAVAYTLPKREISDARKRKVCFNPKGLRTSD